MVLRGILWQFRDLTRILRSGELYLERLFVRGWFEGLLAVVVVFGQLRGGHTADLNVAASRC